MSHEEVDHHESQELLHEDWKMDVGKFESFKKSESDLKSMKDKRLRKFYSQQNDWIEDMERIESGQLDKKEAERIVRKRISDHFPHPARRGQVAVRLSFAFNVLLIGIKLAIVIRSGSISVIASVIDSCLDIVSGSIIFITNCLMRRKNKYKYPAGKSRLEPIGIIIFATCMFTASFQVVTEAIRRIIAEEKTLEVDIYSIIGLAVVVAIKLFLLIFCATYAKGSESAAALAQDHRNDVISNSFSIGTVLLAFYYVWWLDPAGGMAIALYIMVNWAITGLRLVRMLTGKAAKREFVQQVTFLCWNHHPLIRAIDTVRAYHLAHGYLVEVDIILDEAMALKEAHDIGESLQNKLEKFPGVERCFVHLDYEARHAPEHGSIFEETEKEKASRLKKEEKAKTRSEKKQEKDLKNSGELKRSTDLKASTESIELKKTASSRSINEGGSSMEEKERIDSHAGKKLNKA